MWIFIHLFRGHVWYSWTHVVKKMMRKFYVFFATLSEEWASIDFTFVIIKNLFLFCMRGEKFVLAVDQMTIIDKFNNSLRISINRQSIWTPSSKAWNSPSRFLWITPTTGFFLFEWCDYVCKKEKEWRMEKMKWCFRVIDTSIYSWLYIPWLQIQ